MKVEEVMQAAYRLELTKDELDNLELLVRDYQAVLAGSAKFIPRVVGFSADLLGRLMKMRSFVKDRSYDGL